MVAPADFGCTCVWSLHGSRHQPQVPPAGSPEGRSNAAFIQASSRTSPPSLTSCHRSIERYACQYDSARCSRLVVNTSAMLQDGGQGQRQGQLNGTTLPLARQQQPAVLCPAPSRSPVLPAQEVIAAVLAALAAQEGVQDLLVAAVAGAGAGH